jgi:hypothetical protein
MHDHLGAKREKYEGADRPIDREMERKRGRKKEKQRI